MKQKPMKNRVLFAMLRLGADIVLIPSTLILAYGLKFKLNWFFMTFFHRDWGLLYPHAQIEPYIQATGIVLVIWVISFYFSGLYSLSSDVFPAADEFVKVLRGVGFATLQILGISFLFKVLPSSRFVIIYSFLIGVLLIYLSRLFIMWLELRAYKRGRWVWNTIVIGADDHGQNVTEKILLSPGSRYRYYGTLSDAPPSQLSYHLQESFKFLGTVSDIERVLNEQAIHVVFLTKTNFPRREIREILQLCLDRGITVKVASDYIPSQYLGKPELFHGIPIISIGFTPDQPLYFFLKRVGDILISLVLGIVFSPLWLLVALWIRLVSSDGPVLYKQTRVGLNAKEFELFKFRSMVPDSESETGPVMVDTKNETRCIKGGKFLRRWSLDEWPQLINVLKGDMSLVGPRPERPYFVEKFSKDLPFFKMRLDVLPGLTGWAQVNGRSVLTSRPDQKLKYDIYYIQNRCLSLDLKILVLTFFVVLRREESY